MTTPPTVARRPYTARRQKPQYDAGSMYQELMNVQQAIPVARVRSVLADDSVQATDDTIAVDATAGDITLTLPPADQLTYLRVTVYRQDSTANAVVVSGAFALSAVVALRFKGDFVTVQSNGVAWFVVGHPVAFFDVTLYGTVGDGVADDTAAFTAAVAAINAAGHGTLYIPTGTYASADTINIDLPDGAHIIWEGLIKSSVSAKPAVVIGSSSATRSWYTMAGGINIERTAIDFAGSSTGVEFRNVSNGKFVIKRVYGFYENVLYNGTLSSGCAYNQTHLGWMIDGVSTLRCTASGDGFCNEMTFWGGSWSHTSTFLALAPLVPTVHLTVDHFATNALNNLRFIGPAFEDNSLIAKAAFIDGEYVLIVHPRMENTAMPTNYPLEFGAHSQECEILGRGAGLNFDSIVDNGVANTYETRRGVRYRSFGADSAQAIIDVSSDLTSGAYAFQSRDTGGTARYWMRCDGIGFVQEYFHTEKGIRYGAVGDASTFNQRGLFWGVGSPNSVLTARIGSIYMNLSGGASTTLYIKESGDNTNTGWVAK